MFLNTIYNFYFSSTYVTSFPHSSSLSQKEIYSRDISSCGVNTR